MATLDEYEIWVRRLSFYFAIYIAVILISRFVFLKFNLLHTDVDSARYMLSALIQSEAAIIAIVITMSLVAVQLAASSYSVRVIDIFRKKPDLWLLLLTYGFAIFWGLGVLKMIDAANPLMCGLFFNCQSNLESYIIFTYSLGVFAYVALAVYIWHMMGVLRPSTIIDTLAKDITKDNILESIKKENEDEANPNSAILPIIDIVRNALMKYDYETTRDGLRTIRVSTKHIFENETFGGNEREDISNHLLDHLRRISRLAIDKGDEYSINEVIKIIQLIGNVAAEKKLEKVRYNAIIDLGDIGIEAAKRNLEWSTRMVVAPIQKMGLTSIEKRNEKCGLNEISCLENVGMKAIEHELKNAADVVAESLGLFGMKAVECDQSDTISNAISSLEMIGMYAIKKDLYKVIETTCTSLNLIKHSEAERVLENIKTRRAEVLTKKVLLISKTSPIYKNE